MSDRQTAQATSQDAHAAPPIDTRARGGILRRKCACGKSTAGGGECGACERKHSGELRRAAVNNSGGGAEAPPLVREVLRSSGSPLDLQTRSFMESRFGHDFSHVRLHTDAKAAESARAVGALAYTVGSDVVLGAGRHSVGTSDGRRLLAHELTHVVQQSSSPAAMTTGIEIGEPGHRAEHEADETASRVAYGAPAGPVRPDRRTLRRQEAIPVDLVPVSDEENARLKKQGINLPTVSEGTWRLIGGVADNAGKSLTPAEKTNIESILKKAGAPTGTPLATPISGRFLLHDTSASVTASGIAEQQKKGRGPRGSGVTAYVPSSGAATVTRPEFYEARRPSTTEFEKSIESFEKPEDKKLSSAKKVETWKKRRDDLFRQVWNATQPAKRDEAFNKAIAGMSLSADEIKGEKTGNNLKRSDPDFNPGVEAALKAGSTEKVTTSSSWTVEEICNMVTPKTVASVAVSGKETELTDACAALSAYFTRRDARVASTVAVEIVQPGVKKGATNENTCNPKNPDIAPLSNPPYSADQYKSLVQLYLRAAYRAGTFPEVTTHFVVDSFIGGHCDPRCFDLNYLYDSIAGALGHGKGSTYGVKPNYGRSSGTHTVWWDDGICHGKHP